jgi:S-formylglutathione hydrolase FrmB
MKFGVFLPEVALRGQKCPFLYWISGPTCTERNFITKQARSSTAAERRQQTPRTAIARRPNVGRPGGEPLAIRAPLNIG